MSEAIISASLKSVTTTVGLLFSWLHIMHCTVVITLASFPSYSCIVYDYAVLLTLGTHAPEGYGSCPVCVSVCVCVSVRNLNLGTGASRGLNEGTSE